jgi:hypothetical protein
VAQLIKNGGLFSALTALEQTDPLPPRIIVKSYEKALAEARRKLAIAEVYELGDWSWGYKEVVDNRGQAKMRMVYEFAFVPLKSDHRPQLVEVPAEETP